jgi:hypothetical protein
MINLPGDSAEYDMLTRGIALSANVDGLTCELGLRLGGGSKHIIDALAQYAPHKTHIAVDPYGNIEYNAHDNGLKVRIDYTNQMRNTCMANIYPYANDKNVHFIFFNLEDSEFFQRFADGVPVYRENKAIINQYSFVHFDAGHIVPEILKQLDFFWMRSVPGSVFAFDDVVGFYNHDEIEKRLFPHFKLIEKGNKKAIYQKL